MSTHTDEYRLILTRDLVAGGTNSRVSQRSRTSIGVAGFLFALAHQPRWRRKLVDQQGANVKNTCLAALGSVMAAALGAVSAQAGVVPLGFNLAGGAPSHLHARANLPSSTAFAPLRRFACRSFDRRRSQTWSRCRRRSQHLIRAFPVLDLAVSRDHSCDCRPGQHIRIVHADSHALGDDARRLCRSGLRRNAQAPKPPEAPTRADILTFKRPAANPACRQSRAKQLPLLCSPRI